MTRDEYQRICGRLARKAIRYASEMAGEDRPDNVTSEHDHWIEVFLDERLPDIDADVLLDVTGHPRAFEEGTGQAAPSREIAANHAFQADVWDAINSQSEHRPCP